MQCPVCPSTEFTACAYRTESFSAPALECARCGTLVLDESAARSFAERRVIREAIAIRAGIAQRRDEVREPAELPARMIRRRPAPARG